jgi:hypothetical protein
MTQPKVPHMAATVPTPYAVLRMPPRLGISRLVWINNPCCRTFPAAPPCSPCYPELTAHHFVTGAQAIGPFIWRTLRTTPVIHYRSSMKSRWSAKCHQMVLRQHNSNTSALIGWLVVAVPYHNLRRSMLSQCATQ